MIENKFITYGDCVRCGAKGKALDYMIQFLIGFISIAAVGNPFARGALVILTWLSTPKVLGFISGAAFSEACLRKAVARYQVPRRRIQGHVVGKNADLFPNQTAHKRVPYDPSNFVPGGGESGGGGASGTWDLAGEVEPITGLTLPEISVAMIENNLFPVTELTESGRRFLGQPAVDEERFFWNINKPGSPPSSDPTYHHAGLNWAWQSWFQRRNPTALVTTAHIS